MKRCLRGLGADESAGKTKIIGWDKKLVENRSPIVSWKEAYIGWHAGTISFTSLRDFVRFFGIFTVYGRCLDHNTLGLPLMLKHTFRDNRNRAFRDCFTRTSWLQLYCQLQLHHRSGGLADSGWRTNWMEERQWRALFPYPAGHKRYTVAPLYKSVILAQCAEATSRLLSLCNRVTKFVWITNCISM